MGKQWKQWETLFSWTSKSLQVVTAGHENKRHLLLGKKAMTILDSILKSRDITLPTKVHLVKPMVFPVVLYGGENWTIKKAWVPKNWCFWTVLLGKTLESPLDSKEIQPVHPKGNQSWLFIGRTDAEAETPILGPPNVKVSSVQSLSHVRLFVTPWITAHQASLSITNSQSSLKLASIESMMPSSHLILCRWTVK